VSQGKICKLLFRSEEAVDEGGWRHITRSHPHGLEKVDCVIALSAMLDCHLLQTVRINYVSSF